MTDDGRVLVVMVSAGLTGVAVLRSLPSLLSPPSSPSGSRGVARSGPAPDRFPVVLYDADGGDNHAVWAGSFEDFLVDNELTDDERRRVREREEVYLGGGAAPLMFVRRHRPTTVRRIRERLGL